MNDLQSDDDIVDLGCARAETLGPVGPIDELILTGPLPGIDDN